jgi:ubiquinone/menaquinone biosynthesis C-methylase UbiE
MKTLSIMRRGLPVSAGLSFLLLLLLTVKPVCAKDIGPFYGHEKRSVAEWIKLFERPERRRWQKPEVVVQALDISPGQSIADIGAGSGYFTVLFSKAVGPRGQVWAVDIEPAYLDYIRQRLEKEKLDNIIPHLAEPDDPELAEASQDIIFFCNTWHYIEQRGNYLKKLRRILKPAGKLAVIDFKLERIPFGPPYERRLPKPQLITEARAEGFKLWAEYYFLPYQYFVIFKKQ